MRYPSDERDDRFPASNVLSAQIILNRREKYGPHGLQVLWAEKVMARAAAAKDKPKADEPLFTPPEAA